MTKREFAPPHPGEILYYEFMEPYELSSRKVAELIGVPHNRVTEIVRGRRSVSSDTAIRLERLFGFSAQAWLNLQQRYDLETAKLEAEDNQEIMAIQRYEAVA